MCTVSVPSSSIVNEYMIGLQVDWMVNFLLTLPMENLWPSIVQIEIPHFALDA